MDAELKRKWVEALRRGEYLQCRYALHDTGAYCCLGVLWNETNEWDDKPWGVAKELRGASRFQDLFHEEFGLPKDQSTRLADMNDRGASFAEIADYIEANL